MPVNLQNDFAQFQLTGATINNPTSLQFGPDGRLYVAQQDGSFKIFTVQETANGYQVTATQLVTLIKSTPNHNDDGSLNTSVTARQLTGIVVAGTAANPVVYATSSDPRYGKGFDPNIDTNSTTIHRLTLNASGQWEKVDLVRGLPRSEENHAGNGLQYDPATNTLYVAIGGNTNLGAPSNNFGYLAEYPYSAAILTVNLGAIEAMPIKNDTSSGNNHRYIYDLPTLNDPSRADNVETVFGGNDGFNMAKLTADSPVQIYSPGYRNPYDLVITQSGRMYVTDNGGNQGWGGIPVVGPNGVTNLQSQNASGQPDDTGGTTLDYLHLVSGQGYYGGHANPLRANGAAAGLSDSNDNPADGPNGGLLDPSVLPVDWNEVVDHVNPIEGVDQTLSATTSALWGNTQSTNGLAEYTASNFNNEMKNDLLTVGFGGKLYWIQLNAAGTRVDAVSERAISGSPLDVIAQGDNAPFAGTIWMTQYASDSITILKPGQGGPPNTNDDDSDGLSNSVDRFAMDPDNGTVTVLQAGQSLLWSFSPADPDVPGPSTSLFGIGFTGVMSNGVTPYTGLYDIENITPGGAAGVMTVDAVPAGTPAGSANLGQNGFQFGVNTSGAQTFSIVARLDNPFNSVASPDHQSQGIFIGTGDQDNFLSVSVDAIGGAGQFSVTFENGGSTVTSTSYAGTALTGASAQVNDTIDLILDVNTATGIVVPHWNWTSDNGATQHSGTGSAVTLAGPALAALRGSYSVSSHASALAVGLYSTSTDGTPFTASWDSINITAAPAGSTLFEILPGSTNVNATTFNTGSFHLTNTGAKDIVSVTIDLTTSALPGLVYDPAGGAGDAGPKQLTIDSAGGTGAVQLAHGDYSNYTLPLNGGFQSMTVSFDQNVSGGFDPGETMTFSLDIDPTNIRNSGVQADAGSVSGLELLGSTVTVNYADGTSQQSEIFGDGSAGGGEASVAFGDAVAPVLHLAGQSSGKIGVGVQAQTVTVTGAANSTVKVAVITGGTGNNVTPIDIWDANKATAVSYQTVTLNGTGNGSFTINVPTNAPLYIAAAVDDGSAGAPGHVSAPIIVAFDSSSAPPDTTPPGATGAANDLFAATPTHSVVVTYTDVGGSGVDVATVSTDDISVSGPTPVTVSGVSAQVNGDGSVTATYTLASTDGFDTVDNGTYTVSLLAAAVRDIAGNAAAAKTLDSFTVAIGSGAPIVGTEGNETLNGTPNNDVINALGGNDTLNGLAGNDILDGGAGKDKLNGGTGADEMTGGIGDDSYFVDDPGDRVIEQAGGGKDEVNAYLNYTLPPHVENLVLRNATSINGTGNEFDNTITGNSGANILAGGAGEDTLTGAGGADTFLLDAPNGSSADTIKDLTSADRIGIEAPHYGLSDGAGATAGGALNPDWFVQGAAATAAHGQFLYSGGTLRWDADGTGGAPGRLVATLTAAPALTAGQFTVLNVGAPPVDSAPPTSIGTADDLNAAAATHNVTVTYADAGGSGVDASTLGTNDISVSGTTAVTVNSFSTATNGDGSITATYVLGSAGGFDGTDNGTYTVFLVTGSVSDIAGNGVAGKTLDTFVVNVGGSGPAPINGTAGDDTINGTSGDDTINGLAGNDTLNGLAGVDTINGGDGKDKIDGGTGADLMTGGSGDDVYFAENTDDSVIELAGGGKDEVNAYINYILAPNVENLRLRNANPLDGTGNDLANSIFGNSAINHIDGGDGNDTILGSGAGDFLTGGAGADLFDYDALGDSRGTGVDHILDFTVGQDRIDLSTIDANSATTGNQAFSFIGSAAFSNVAGQLRFDTSTPGSTAIFADVDGNGVADLEIRIDQTVTLTQASFVL